MLDLLRSLVSAPGDDQNAASAPPPSDLASLRMLAAPMLLLTGLEATLDSLLRTRPASPEAPGGEEEWSPAAPSYAAIWAPSLLAPLAAAAQVAHLSRPSETISTASRVLNTAVVGAGVGATAQMLLACRRRAHPASLAPLALTAAGLLALLLDREERKLEAERARLERRARIVERLVPRRRPKLERVVVHV